MMKKILIYFSVCLFCFPIFGQQSTTPKKGKALIVVSNSFYHGDSDIIAGNSFSEVAIAYDVFIKAGYQTDLVSPKGGSVPLAYINTSDPIQFEYIYNVEFMHKLKTTKQPRQINPMDYKIVHYSGGSSPIFDIPDNEPIQKIVMKIYEENNGIIGAVCHGTAGIVNLKTKDGKYLIAGKNVNGFPDFHESKDLPYYQHYPFIIEKKIKERGANFKYEKEIGKEFVIIDGRLITGQNFQSTKKVALKSIELIETCLK